MVFDYHLIVNDNTEYERHFTCRAKNRSNSRIIQPLYLVIIKSLLLLPLPALFQTTIIFSLLIIF